MRRTCPMAAPRQMEKPVTLLCPNCGRTLTGWRGSRRIGADCTPPHGCGFSTGECRDEADVRRLCAGRPQPMAEVTANMLLDGDHVLVCKPLQGKLLPDGTKLYT
jgi:hypothetical protein